LLIGDKWRRLGTDGRQKLGRGLSLLGIVEPQKKKKKTVLPLVSD
jgi:hypothetical protein